MEKGLLFPSELLQKFGVVDWGHTEELNPQSYDRYDQWVSRGDHGELNYLADYRKDKRKSLKTIYPEAKSALVFLFSYHPQKIAANAFYESGESNSLKVASYVTGFKGKDYHLVIADYLNELGTELKKSYSSLEYRLSLDIHPVLERDLAYRCGLGWFGKNSMLISREHGSFFMIGSLILNQSLELGAPILESDHCGQCRACVEACPTDAIDEKHRTLVAEKCISTWTIEHFKEGPLPPKGMENASGLIFGCDICQEVCPWNKRPVREGLKAQDLSEFKKENHLILSEFLMVSKSAVISKVEEISNNAFAKKFKETPLGRTGRRGFLKNLYFWK